MEKTKKNNPADLKRIKPYVQFSKRMVVFVSICVTALCSIGIGLCALYAQMDYVADIVKAYIGYATICFAAYSGNSVVEKWLVYHKDDPSHEIG